MTNINNADFSVPSQQPTGAPIVGTSSFQQIHVVPTNFLDEVYVWVNNPTNAAVIAQLRFGNVGGPTIQVRVPALTTFCVLNGLRMRNGTNSSVSIVAPGCVVFTNVNTLQKPS